MLVLARKPTQKIVIGGDIIVHVIRNDRGVVKLGIEAPANVSVHRQEIYDEIQRENRTAILSRETPVPKLARPQPI